MKIFLHLIFVILSISTSSWTQAKRAKCVDKLNKYDQDFFYCTKFAVGPGRPMHAWYYAKFTANQVHQANYRAHESVKDRKHAYVTIAIFSHSHWQKVLKVKGTDQEACKAKENLSEEKMRVEVPLDGSFKEGWLTKTVQHMAGPQMYYIAVMDCDDDLHLLLGDYTHGRIEVRTHISDGDEFSYEKKGIITIDIIFTAIYIGIFALNFKDWFDFQKRHDMWNTPHIYCIIAMLFQAISIIIDLVSNLRFSRTGDESLVLDILSSFFAMINECTMICLLLMIANGWMTRWTKYDFDEGMEVYVPLFLLVLMIHFTFAALSFIDRNAYHKYHNFHGWSGMGLIFAKFVLVGVYFYFYTCTKPLIQKNAQAFYDQVVHLGLLYVLSDPILLLGTYILSEWNMAYYYNISDNLMHICLQTYFLYQMRWQSSGFTKSLDNINVLPSGQKNQ